MNGFPIGDYVDNPILLIGGWNHLHPFCILAITLRLWTFFWLIVTSFPIPICSGNYIFIWRVKKKLSRCAQKHTSRRICWACCQHLVPWSFWVHVVFGQWTSMRLRFPVKFPKALRKHRLHSLGELSCIPGLQGGMEYLFRTSVEKTVPFYCRLLLLPCSCLIQLFCCGLATKHANAINGNGWENFICSREFSRRGQP